MGSRTFNDAALDLISVGNPALLQISTGSVFCWVKTTVGGVFKGIVVKQDAYGMFVSSNTFVVYNWAASTPIDSGVTINDGVWHNVGMTFNGATVTLWVDGVSYQAGHSWGVVSQAQPLLFGNGNTFTQYLNGSIGEPCTWSDVRSSTDAANLYGGGTAGALPSTISPTTIIGYWPLRGVQPTEPDCSTSNGINGGTANGNDGALTGTGTGSAPPVAYQTSPVNYSATGITFFLPQVTSVNFTKTGTATFAGGTANPTTGLTVDQAYQLNLTSGTAQLSWPVGSNAVDEEDRFLVYPRYWW